MKFYHKEGCPLCGVALKKLEQKNLKYEDIMLYPDDPNDKNFIALCEAGIKQLPALQLDDGSFLTGANVSKWINQQEAKN